MWCICISFFFFFNDTATTEIYTLSLHDALPILALTMRRHGRAADARPPRPARRSEEHTSELQSHSDLVCRLLLEKKKNHNKSTDTKQPKKNSNEKNITVTIR